MRIGEVAQRAGVTTKTIRFYESRGLLSVDRRPNGYRDYDESHVSLVREIQSLGDLGIRIQQTQPFLDCLTAGNEHGDDCSASLAAYREAIDALDTRISDLTSRRERLIELLAGASTRAEPACQFAQSDTIHQREAR